MINRSEHLDNTYIHKQEVELRFYLSKSELEKMADKLEQHMIFTKKKYVDGIIEFRRGEWYKWGSSLVSFGVTGIEPHHAPGLWLFSAVPVIALEHATSCSVLMALLGQWLAITIGSGVMVRQLNKAGESEMKALVSAN